MRVEVEQGKCYCAMRWRQMEGGQVDDAAVSTAEDKSCRGR